MSVLDEDNDDSFVTEDSIDNDKDILEESKTDIEDEHVKEEEAKKPKRKES